MNYKVTEVDGAVSTVSGQSPTWLGEDKAVIYVDTTRKRILYYCTIHSTSDCMDLNETVGFVVPIASNDFEQKDIFLAVGLENTIVEVNFTKKHILRTIASRTSQADMRFNCGKCSADGTLFAGISNVNWRDGKRGSVHMLTKKLEFEQSIASSTINYPNGCTWSGNNFYLVDAGANVVFSFAMFDRRGNKVLINKKSVFALAADAVDAGYLLGGLAVDAESMLWIPIIGAGQILRVDPNTCQEIARIEMPCKYPTCCAFGGENFDELFVTSSDEIENISEPSGKLYRVVFPGEKLVYGFPVHPMDIQSKKKSSADNKNEILSPTDKKTEVGVLKMNFDESENSPILSTPSKVDVIVSKENAFDSVKLTSIETPTGTPHPKKKQSEHTPKTTEKESEKKQLREESAKYRSGEKLPELHHKTQTSKDCWADSQCIIS